MGRVASFGSINVDRVAPLDRATLAALDDRYAWFPAPGETRTVDAIPSAVDEHVAELFPGGKGANGAVAAARAGAGVALYGMVGPDAADLGALSELRAADVDVEAVREVDEPTGTAYVFVDPDGENHIATLRGANAAVDPAYAHTHADAVRAADSLLVANEVPAGAIDALFAALDGQRDRPTVVFDPAPVGGAADLLAHPCVDVTVPNEHEAAALADALAATSATVVRTRGPDPVVVEGEEDTPASVPVPDADPVDTTGAGDVFAGYLAAGLAEDESLRPAVERACVAAARSVERRGVQRAAPPRDRIGTEG